MEGMEDEHFAETRGKQSKALYTIPTMDSGHIAITSSKGGHPKDGEENRRRYLQLYFSRKHKQRSDARVQFWKETVAQNWDLLKRIKPRR